MRATRLLPASSFTTRKGSLDYYTCIVMFREAQPPVKKRADGAVTYMLRLREDLPKEDYEEMVHTLNHFRKGTLSAHAVVDKVVDILCRPSRHHLLGGFEQYLEQGALARFRAKYGAVVDAEPSLQPPQGSAFLQLSGLHSLSLDTGKNRQSCAFKHSAPGLFQGPVRGSSGHRAILTTTTR